MSDAALSFDVDLAELRPAIIDVAERVLTQRQLEIFVLHFFEGQTVNEIAHCLGVKHPVISEAINGRDGRHPGILKRMGEALKQDTQFQKSMADAKNPQKHNAKGSDFVGWFRKVRPHEPHMFIHLAVLLYASAIADESRRTSIGTLCEHMPAAIVNASITPLRLMGYIMTDGIIVTILKTPIEPKEGVA